MNNHEKTIKQAADLLRAGELVAIPTETVYGLGADAANASALAKIFAAKGRPADHPLIVHIAKVEQLTDWARDVPEMAYVLAAAFWPGPLTLILKKAPGVDDLITGGQDTIGLRMPNHSLALELLQEFGGGLAAPSANRFGRISPTTAAAVYEELGDAVALVLDGGQCAVGVESTILDISDGRPVILRPGMITAAAIELVLKQPVLAQKPNQPRVSGSHAIHYAPQTPTELVTSENVQSTWDHAVPSALVCYSAIEQPVPGVQVVQMSHDPQQYAHDLYFVLRDLDKKNLGQILIEEVPTTAEWDAVRDRLSRASAKNSDERKAYNVAEQPNSYQYLSVSPVHEIFIQEYGNEQGLPVIVVHGGPGGGCPPAYAGFFDPQRYRIILVDQRGSGKSMPPGELTANNTAQLIADIEKVRNALRIERWVVFGGSWGTTLGLLYAQAHPDRVIAMVLRGIFLARQQDIDSFIGADTEAAEKCPQDWLEFKTNVDDLRSRLKLTAADNYVDAVLELLDYPDAEIRDQSAAILCKWEYQISFRKPAPMPKDFNLGGYAMALIELTYMQKKCFIAENQILENLQLLPKVPIFIVHGRKDWVCPIIQAELLNERLKIFNDEVSYHATAAGHAGSEPENTHYLVKATDAIADRFFK